jgi:hypothetical protein
MALSWVESLGERITLLDSEVVNRTPEWLGSDQRLPKGEKGGGSRSDRMTDGLILTYGVIERFLTFHLRGEKQWIRFQGASS